MTQKTAAGLRRKNPGNIRWVASNKWNGLADPPKDEAGFCIFRSAVYGIRALAVLLLAYQDRFDCNTVTKVITRWAPPPENAPLDNNPTASYIRFVAQQMNVRPDVEIDLHNHDTMRSMVCAIIKFENGVQPYGDTEIDKALGLAGLPAGKPPDVPKSAKVAVGTTAASGAAGTLGQQLQDIGGVLQPFASASKWIAIAFAVITIGVLIYMMWGMYDRSRREPT